MGAPLRPPVEGGVLGSEGDEQRPWSGPDGRLRGKVPEAVAGLFYFFICSFMSTLMASPASSTDIRLLMLCISVSVSGRAK